MKIDTGRLGETLVEVELLKRGWHVIRLDGRSSAPNADLLATHSTGTSFIQVKATKEAVVYMGSAEPWVVHKKPYFNRVQSSPIKASAMVFVAKVLTDPQFYVFRAQEAEDFARDHTPNYYERGRTEGKENPAAGYVKIRLAEKILAQKLEPHRNAWDRIFDISGQIEKGLSSLSP